MSETIDVHAHYFPVEYLDALEEAGSETTGAARNLNAGGTEEELEKRFKMMDAAGVDRQVVSATPQMPYFEDREVAVSLAKLANDSFAVLVDRYPDRFTALAATPLPHGEAAAFEVERAMDDLGMPGINVSTVVLDQTLKNPDFDPMWKAVDQREGIVFVHAAGNGCDSPLINDHGLKWIVGAPFEDTIGLLHLLQANIPGRFPNIKFIIAHLGGPLPFHLQRIDDISEHWGADFPDKPSEMIQNIWFDSVNSHAPSLRCAAETYGSDRILLGSDFPYFQDDLYQRSVDYIKHADLEEETVEGILRSNAEKILQ